MLASNKKEERSCDENNFIEIDPLDKNVPLVIRG
jgi:hypothetical protein